VLPSQSFLPLVAVLGSEKFGNSLTTLSLTTLISKKLSITIKCNTLHNIVLSIVLS
jgi:hypothetical protein